MSTRPLDVKNLAEVYQRRLKRLDRLAIAVAKLVGSWSFLLWQTVFIAGWIIVNLIGWARSWDPYPFILMMVMQEDYETNQRAAEELRTILDMLEQHGQLLAKLVEQRQSRDGSGPPVAGAPTGAARS